MPKRKGASIDAEVEGNGDGGANKDKSESTILAIMMQFYIDEKHDVSFEDVAVEIGCHERNNAWRALWTSVKKKGYIEASSEGNKGFQLTQKGIDLAATDEYKQLSIKPKTNEEYQDRIKKRFKQSKCLEIFDLLDKHGSLTRFELAGLIGQKDRSHAFSYSLQELKKDKKLVEEDPSSSTVTGKGGKKLRLADKAYLKPEFRPKPMILDSKVLEDAVKANGTSKSRKTTATEMKSSGKSKDGGDGSGSNNKDEGDSSNSKSKCEEGENGVEKVAKDDTTDGADAEGGGGSSKELMSGAVVGDDDDAASRGWI